MQDISKIPKSVYKEVAQIVSEQQKMGKFTKKGRAMLEEAKRLEYLKNNVRCTKCPDFADSIDHIVPDYLLLQFGVDVERTVDEENWQPMCRRCNAYKSNRLDFANPKTKKLLIKYVNLIPDLFTNGTEIPTIR